MDVLHPIAALLRNILATLLVACIALGGLGGAASALVLGDECGASDCPCDADQDHGDDHDERAADEQRDDAHDAPCCTENAADGGDDEESAADEHSGCDEEHAPCPPGCDDCHCATATAHALPGTSRLWLDAPDGTELDLASTPHELHSSGPATRLDRPPRSVLG